jgi:hypothetical protein
MAPSLWWQTPRASLCSLPPAAQQRCRAATSNRTRPQRPRRCSVSGWRRTSRRCGPRCCDSPCTRRSLRCCKALGRASGCCRMRLPPPPPLPFGVIEHFQGRPASCVIIFRIALMVSALWGTASYRWSWGSKGAHVACRHRLMTVGLLDTLTARAPVRSRSIDGIMVRGCCSQTARQ